MPPSDASTGKQRVSINWHGSCSRRSGPRFFFLERGRKVRRMKNEYDLASAITFFLAGLGIGSVLALIFNPRERLRLEGSKAVTSRGGGLQEGERRERRIA